jgi:hypothetical protein
MVGEYAVLASVASISATTASNLLRKIAAETTSCLGGIVMASP